MSSDTLQNLAQALFILPFFLFSATAGQLADKYEKSRLITITVAIELAVMLLGAVGLFSHSLALLLGALFLGGVQSALFGPVKYAILPQNLSDAELVGGNGLVETGTSIAILAGMIAGGWMIAAVALYIYTLVPEFLMRFMVWMLIHSVYRLKKLNLERIPEEGAALVVCNHVSYVDALVISAACRRARSAG